MATCISYVNMAANDKQSRGGSRANSGRKRHHPTKLFKQRVIRISLYEDHSRWKAIKVKAGKRSDPQFCQYLLELAERALDE